MKKHYYLITGTSRGIGEGLANELLKSDNFLICFSRSINRNLVNRAGELEMSLDYYSADLSDSEKSAELFRSILSQLDKQNVLSLTLIHNAGALEPLAAVGKEKDLSKIEQSLTVNLTTPIVTTEVFTNLTQDWAIDKKVLFVSSGAAIKAYHAWSMYCSSKAGLEMFAQCLAVDQESETHPIKVVSLAPGVVDTAMQDYLRELNEETFRHVQRFKDLKTNDQLWSPAFVAEKMVELLQSSDFGKEVRLDLRDLV